MVFLPADSSTKLQYPPDSIPICDFMFNEKYGRHPLKESKPPFTCGLSGVEYSATETRERVKDLAKGLAKELGWEPNKDTEWDKVVGVFAFNTIDTLTLAWAIHRLSGISSPANSAYTAAELAHQLKASNCKALFTCLPLLPAALEAAAQCNIPKTPIYLISLPEELTDGRKVPVEHKTVDQLINEGQELAPLEELRWEKGQGGWQTAFLCFSSGTSGQPKAVMISHRNVIANIMQITAHEAPYREFMKKTSGLSPYLEVALGLLPQSHIYSLIVICHASCYRGDQVINLPKFELNLYLNTIQQFKIQMLYLAPPIIVLMIRSKPTLDKYDLSSVSSIFTCAAPLGMETILTLQDQHPTWAIKQGYGLTESAVGVTSTVYDDVDFGSSGSLLPGVQARLISLEGDEITDYEQRGELLLRSPSVALGYLNNDKANKETFQDGWLRTGDEAMFKLSPRGTEHMWITDRIKELIKVKGLGVAPAELEAHILTHPAVADVAVIGVLDEAAGELPKAFVVKSRNIALDESEDVTVRSIQEHVEEHKAHYKWLKGGVEFIDVVPKSSSGKILRRLLRDKDREATG